MDEMRWIGRACVIAMAHIYICGGISKNTRTGKGREDEGGSGGVISNLFVVQCVCYEDACCS